MRPKLLAFSTRVLNSRFELAFSTRLFNWAHLGVKVGAHLDINRGEVTPLLTKVTRVFNSRFELAFSTLSS